MTTSALHLPTSSLSPAEVRDLELALFGLLPEDHLLAGAVDGERSPAPSGAVSTSVRMAVPPPTAQLALAAAGLVLRDEEGTPLAELREVETTGATTSDGWVLLRGRLQPGRTRESGTERALALSRDDLAPGPVDRALVVLRRPPLTSDTAALEPLLRQAPDGLYVVVADSPDSPVPLPVLLACARAWITGMGLSGRARLRVAPLAWRDEASDARLVRSVASALGAGPVLELHAHGDAPGAATWRAVRAQLAAGAEAPEEGVAPAVLACLRGWLPPRSARGLVLMFSGLSGSGKSTLARDVTSWILGSTTRKVTLLDGDVVRTMLSSGLGFDRPARDLNVRRIGFVAAEVARHGGIAVCAPIAPYASTREDVRRMAAEVGDFVLVHVSTPVEECERRDLKGLYAKARAGLIPEFTGVTDPYEVPTDADLSVDTSVMDRAEALGAVIDLLVRGGWIPEEPS